ncbi:MAG: hypothetical protein LBR84_11370, partial [Tannerella sp.]|nr:hypothetical protein [Tannerella sp.]
IQLTVCFENLGDVVLGSPVFMTVYRDSISSASQHKIDSLIAYLLPDDDTCKVFKISVEPKFTRLIVRLNDKGFLNGVSRYPWQVECHYNDSVFTSLNPAMSLYMKKRATLNGVAANGTYANPVAVLNSEQIKYDITAVNANTAASGRIIIRDTLPDYLDPYGVTIAAPLDSVTTAPGSPARKVMHWSISGMAPYASQTVSFFATPQPGAVASQPMFANRAWVTVSDTLNVPTDSSTYHQGAGVAVVTFSAGAGGFIFNGDVQAVDYRSTLRTGVVIVPDEGYEFVGWSHDAYVSLRDVEIPAANGIMHYDTLTVYGDVELRADFAPLSPTASEPAVIASDEALSAPTVWANGAYLYVRTSPASVIARNEAISPTTTVLRVYTLDGVLRFQQAILTSGVSKFKLPSGVYIATLNNSIGAKVRIE